METISPNPPCQALGKRLRHLLAPSPCSKGCLSGSRLIRLLLHPDHDLCNIASPFSFSGHYDGAEETLNSFSISDPEENYGDSQPLLLFELAVEASQPSRVERLAVPLGSCIVRKGDEEKEI